MEGLAECQQAGLGSTAQEPEPPAAGTHQSVHTDSAASSSKGSGEQETWGIYMYVAMKSASAGGVQEADRADKKKSLN